MTYETFPYRAPTRRGFLASGGAYAAASAIVPRRPVGAPSPAAWRDLADGLRGQLLLPDAPGFAKRARPNNLRYETVVPAAIVRCGDEADVGHALRWAQHVNMPLAVRSGGHSYAGCSTTAGLLIDMSPICDVRVVEDVVEFGGGALNGHAYAALKRAGLAVTHGRCFGVGVSAFLMGGGIGFGMRDHGLGCDAVLAARLVTPGGEILDVTATENPDLFWALRGGGGGTFGIATRFRVRAVRAEPVCMFDLAWSEQPEDVLQALLAVLDRAPDRLGSRVEVSAVTPQEHLAGRDCEVKVLGQLRGPRAELDAILAPVRGVAVPSRERIGSLDYWDAQRLLGEPGPPGRYQEKSRFCHAPVPAAAMREIFRWARRWPGATKHAAFKFFQAGGRIKAVAPQATAYVHRDADWLFGVEVSWGEADAPGQVARDLGWQEEFYEAVWPLLNQPGGAYQNFVDPTLRDAGRAYFGENLARLRAVKQSADPGGVLRMPAGVPMLD